MLEMAEDWMWDFWFATEGGSYHVFFLAAPRSLQDPHLRHHNARVGHAVSTDLVTWTQLPDALVPGSAGSFDDVATWTGSVLRHPAGGWWMFYTGVTPGRTGLIQRIGAATSEDLLTWRKHPDNPLVVADRRWYELDGDDGAIGEEFRDPWVLPDPDGTGWHMLITARSAVGAPDDRGIIGHAVSDDLVHWQVRPPLVDPGAGFAHLEVSQVAEVHGRAVLLFSCLRDRFAAARLARDGNGGVWAAAGASLLGPFDVAGAVPLTDSSLYSGRLIRDPSGRWVLLAFEDIDAEGRFGGRLSDPMPVGWDRDGRLTVLGRPTPVRQT